MNKCEMMETWFQRVWHEEDLDAIDEMMDATVSVIGLQKTPQVGPGVFRVFAQALLVHIKDIKITIEQFVEQGDWCSMLMHISATGRDTGAPVSFSGLAMVRIVNERFAEAYNYIDFIELYEQIGVMPKDTMARCLGGTSLT